jgi:hypothetical protein
MTAPKRWIAAIAATCCVACSPTLDWREFVVDGSDLTVAFPCRPDRYARTVVLVGERMQMTMLTCTVAGSSYAISFVVVADPGRVSAALAELRIAAVSNVQGREPHLAPLSVRGMTPNDEAMRLAIVGHLPDGIGVHEHAAFFARGMRAYQATVIGVEPAAQAVEPFFGGLKFSP